MTWFNVLKGSRRSASGLEWRIWRKLPHATLAGTLIPTLPWLACYGLMPSETNALQSQWMETAGYIVVGVVTFHWFLMLTLAVGCAIVIVMKGPAYVADAYPLSHSDHPRSDGPEATDNIAK
jgi:hypothetical protein